MEDLLRVEALCREPILDRVSFTMNSGEMVAIMGPSGSGKSTLLYQVAGMDQPTSGRVYLAGQEITGISEVKRAEIRLHRMGFVFQQMNMMGKLNILDNILLPAAEANRVLHNRSKLELRKEAESLMQKLSVLELKERSITEVSGGQLQRACICRSMINRPEILLADEPTGALNKSAAAEVMDTFVKLNQEGTTILLVTHDSKVAGRCGRILYLLDGRICGELLLQRPGAGTQKRREETVNQWLEMMGW